MTEQEQSLELMDLSKVHSFYVATLEQVLGHPIPLPHEVVNADGKAEQVEQSISTLRRFLNLLDMAMSASLMRDALKQDTHPESNEAMLRYYARKSMLHSEHRSESDRDKADLIVTSICRNPRGGVNAAASLGGEHSHEEAARVAQEFERELSRILEGVARPGLEGQHAQLLKEFEYLHPEVEDFRSFEQLMESGIIQRVRHLKDSFGAAFYRPEVLAHAAVYNVVFGRKFDELFHLAAEQIRSFAEKLQSEGASILSKVEDDVTVKHLTEIEGGRILNAEYGTAKEELRKVAKAKRAIDRRRGTRPAVVAASAPAAVETRAFAASASVGAVAGASAAFGDGELITGAAMAMEFTPQAVQPVRPVGVSAEQGKFTLLREQIRGLVRASESRVSTVVPLQKGTLVLSAAEAEAFRPDFGNEKSFRVDYANALCELVTAYARFMVELAEFRAKDKSEYLWKPHADSLAFLLKMVPDIEKQMLSVLAIAEKRGLVEKVAIMNAARQKLAREIVAATRVLSNIQTKSS